MREEALSMLKQAIIDCDVDETVKFVRECLKIGVSARDIIKGMAKGMEVVGEKFENHEYFLPELIMAGNAMSAGLEILTPHLKAENIKGTRRVVIGTVKGDIHDIGKSLVTSMLRSAGLEVYDVGVDVPPDTFVDKAREVNADIVALSALLTTTMLNMEEVIDALKKAGIRDKVKVIVGGRPVSDEFAKRIGADAYAKDAFEAAKVVRRLLHER